MLKLLGRKVHIYILICVRVRILPINIFLCQSLLSSNNIPIQLTLALHLWYCVTLTSTLANTMQMFHALQWLHNGCDGVPNCQPNDCLLNRSFRRISKKTSKLRVTGLCAGNSPVTGEFLPQKVSNAENFSSWWRHHGEGRRKFIGNSWRSPMESMLWIWNHIHCFCRM